MDQVNLPANVQAQIAVIRRDLKGESKNNLVRALIGYMIKEAQMTKTLNAQGVEIEGLKKEAKLTDGFILQNEAAFQAYVESQAEVIHEPAQAVDDQKVG